MIEPRFDDLIHAPIRLSTVSMLARTDGVEFRFIRDQLDVTDSVLSKHVSALEAAGYVTVRKENIGKGRRKTWLYLTEEGLAAFRGHVAALDQIVATARLGEKPPDRT